MEREKALDMALAQIERQFGEGAVMKMGERGQMKVEAVSSGSLAIDVALGIGGLPQGELLRFTVLKHRESPPWRCTSWRKPSAREGSALM